MTLCSGCCGVGGYDQLCCPASPKLLLGLDLGLGCDNKNGVMLRIPIYGFPKFRGFGPRGICPMGILSLNIFVIRNIGGILS